MSYSKKDGQDGLCYLKQGTYGITLGGGRYFELSCRYIDRDSTSFGYVLVKRKSNRLMVYGTSPT